MIVFLTVLIVVGALGNLLVFLVYLKQFKASATRVFVLGMAVCDFLTNVLTLPWSTYEGKYASGIWDCRNGLLHRRVWPADDLLRTDIYRIYQQKKRLLRAGQGVTNKCKFFGQQNVHTEKRKGTALVKTPAVSRDQGVFITSESSDSCASDGTKESSCSQNVENIAVTDFTTNQKQEKPCDVSDARGCTAVSEDVAKSLIVTTTIGSPNRNDEDKSREEDTSRSFAHGRQSVEQGQKRKPFMSRTTLMMFVLTVATLLFCVPPNFAVMLANVQYRSVHNSSWKINLYFLARFIPTLNSVINPFIYSFCNPKFRLQCRNLFTKMRNAFCRKTYF
ncbi:uncharacterized protein LOC112567560 [Pomacea canaliculata]|uniref:uncharacterized protein LOC112567560 n=1 Tax=Pomacea canaliculata TaxID=400727 RepID=UPI000D73BA36|nr:uncharacterized protein LOC112567560 [Pomacea canaliculata]